MSAISVQRWGSHCKDGPNRRASIGPVTSFAKDKFAKRQIWLRDKFWRRKPCLMFKGGPNSVSRNNFYFRCQKRTETSPFCSNAEKRSHVLKPAIEALRGSKLAWNKRFKKLPQWKCQKTEPSRENHFWFQANVHGSHLSPLRRALSILKKVDQLQSFCTIRVIPESNGAPCLG